MSREARRLNELEADIAKLQAHLIQKRRDLQVEIQEIGCVMGTAGEEYWVRWCWQPGERAPLCKSWKNVSHLFFENWLAANVQSNLEAPGLELSERSRKWNELREIQESIANKKQRVAPLENGL